MKDDSNFEVRVTLKDAGQETYVNVHHQDETFEIDLHGKTVSILNNGDNSWSLVDGDLDQLDINLIGDANRTVL